jgi:hypothetical protein
MARVFCDLGNATGAFARLTLIDRAAGCEAGWQRPSRDSTTAPTAGACASAATHRALRSARTLVARLPRVGWARAVVRRMSSRGPSSPRASRARWIAASVLAPKRCGPRGRGCISAAASGCERHRGTRAPGATSRSSHLFTRTSTRGALARGARCRVRSRRSLRARASAGSATNAEWSVSIMSYRLAPCAAKCSSSRSLKASGARSAIQ